MHTLKPFGHPATFVSVSIGPLLTKANSEAYGHPPALVLVSMRYARVAAARCPQRAILLEISRLE